MQVVVDEILTSYDDIGKGPVLVCLHGWADSKETWRPLTKTLASDYRIITVDLPGHGATASPTSVWQLSDFRIFVEHFLAKIGVTDVTALIGHSNGGSIAIKLVAQNDVKVNGLVLLASAGIRNTQKSRKTALRVIAKSGKAATSILPAKMQDSIKSKFYNKIGSDALVLPQMRDTFVNIVSEDLQDVSGSITIPTLLIYGSEDTDAPAVYGHKFQQKIIGSQFIIIDGAGHFLHQTHTNEVQTSLEVFLTKLVKR